MMPLKKLFNLSSRLTDKKARRRNRNRIRKIFRLMVPLSIILSIISICLIVILIQVLRKPSLISPVATTFFDDSVDDDKFLEEIEKNLQDKKISYSSINKLSNSILIKLTNSGEVIISLQKDPSAQIHSLQYMLSHLTMEGKDFARLDLRFDKPVIVLR